MRFLVDNALSPVVAATLSAEGHDAVHVRDYGMQTATDEEIILKAAAEDRIVVSADTDFAAILAVRDASGPSLILFRSNADRRPLRQAATILRNLPSIEGHLQRGAIVTVEAARIRVRQLPIGSDWPDEQDVAGKDQ